MSGDQKEMFLWSFRNSNFIYNNVAGDDLKYPGYICTSYEYAFYPKCDNQ